jgi:hypothetical protein
MSTTTMSSTHESDAMQSPMFASSLRVLIVAEMVGRRAARR